MMPAGVQAAGVDGVKAIDVFAGIDRFEQARGVHVGWQWKLDEDAVDLIAQVELGDEVKQFLGGDAGWRRVHLGVEAEFAAGLDLAAHVDLRSGDIADEDDREAGRVTLFPGCGRIACDLLLDLCGNRHTIQNTWAHRNYSLSNRRHTERISRRRGMLPAAWRQGRGTEVQHGELRCYDERHVERAKNVGPEFDRGADFRSKDRKGIWRSDSPKGSNLETSFDLATTPRQSTGSN
jgi:hypothetical protein